MQVQVRVPDELQPAACIVLRSAHIGGYEKSLVLSEELGLPVGIEGVRSIHEAVRDRPPAGQEERTDLVLAVARLDSRAVGKPVTRAAFDSAAITADGIAKQEAFVRIAIEILIIYEEVLSAKVMRKAFGTNCLHAKIHVRQEG